MEVRYPPSSEWSWTHLKGLEEEISVIPASNVLHRKGLLFRRRGPPLSYGFRPWNIKVMRYIKTAVMLERT